MENSLTDYKNINEINEDELKIQMAKKQIEDVKEKMVDNIAHIIERENSIESISKDTYNILDNSKKLNTQTNKLKKLICLKNIRNMVISIFIFLLFIFFLIFICCGFNMNKC